MDSVIYDKYLFWSRKHLRYEDLPTFQELLREVDPITLARVVVDCQNEENSVKGEKTLEWGSGEYFSLLGKYVNAIEEMRAMTLPPAGERQVMVPRCDVYQGVHSKLIYIQFLCRLRWADVPKAVEAAGEVGLEPRESGQLWGSAHVSGGFPILHTVDSPWEEVLGTRVWMGGTPFSGADRLQMLASVVEDMTFWGFTSRESGRVLARVRESVRRERAGEWEPAEEPRREGPPKGLGRYGLGFKRTVVDSWRNGPVNKRYEAIVDQLKADRWNEFLLTIAKMAEHFDEFRELDAGGGEGDAAPEGSEAALAGDAVGAGNGGAADSDAADDAAGEGIEAGE